ncbi:MAG TPA: metalloregulator ArsR/SmtB family transcription factor [Pyrinomonadaceae bacterium]|jgi:ArsR family transcriptional regulator
MGQTKGFNAAFFFAALADRTRLRLLNLMRDGEVCVCFLAETLQTNDPKISRHLSYLKRADLVRYRREGKWMHYRINEPSDAAARQILVSALDLIRADAEMQRDLKRLIKVCCPPSAPVRIARSGK